MREAQKAPTGDVSDFIEDCCHPLVQSELQWLLELVELVQATPKVDAIKDEARKRAKS